MFMYIAAMDMQFAKWILEYKLYWDHCIISIRNESNILYLIKKTTGTL